MERKCLNDSLKDHCTRDCTATNHHHHHHQHQHLHQRQSIVKSPWINNNNSYQSYAEDYLGGLSWPPRSYSCSFCKREFGSAQALGGHMNVHRRDRARLRQSSPPPSPQPPKDHGRQHPILCLNLNHTPKPDNPSPNPNFSSSSSSPSIICPPPSFARALPLTVPTTMPLFPTPLSEFSSSNCSNRVGEIDCWGRPAQGPLILQDNTNVARLDLKTDFKEDLDLELRLGYSQV